jgi:hypothetical protein
MIAVSQENSHKSLVKRSIASLNKTARTVRAWSGNQNNSQNFLFSLVIYCYSSFPSSIDVAVLRQISDCSAKGTFFGKRVIYVISVINEAKNLIIFTRDVT